MKIAQHEAQEVNEQQRAAANRCPAARCPRDVTCHRAATRCCGRTVTAADLHLRGARCGLARERGTSGAFVPEAARASDSAMVTPQPLLHGSNRNKTNRVLDTRSQIPAPRRELRRAQKQTNKDPDSGPHESALVSVGRATLIATWGGFAGGASGALRGRFSATADS
ncbi:unnamed protein product [Lampetra fluviatilis]